MAITRRALGRTGEDVTILGYGAMELRGEPRGRPISDEEAERILNTVLDSGINLIDTSIDYGNSESLIGRNLSQRRDEFFLASKCGCSLDPNNQTMRMRDSHNYSRENIRAGIEQSLARLRTDHIDLLQVHMSPSKEQLDKDETVETLQMLRDEGKVRFLGMSGTLPNLPDHLAMGVFDVFQIPYSAVQREHEDLITEAAVGGAGTLIRGGAARGSLSEDKNWSVPVHGLAEGEGQRWWDESGFEDALGGMSRHEFILRFTLSHPGLSSTIVGSSNVDHVRSNIVIAEKGPLPSDIYELAKRHLESGDGSRSDG